MQFTLARAMKLSVLDQSASSNNRPHAAAIRDSIELAQHCDRLGYQRYWMSEHHNSDSIVGLCGVTDPVHNSIHIRHLLARASLATGSYRVL